MLKSLVYACMEVFISVLRNGQANSYLLPPSGTSGISVITGHLDI